MLDSLDHIAGVLQGRGLKRFASEIDVVSNTLESAEQAHKEPSAEEGKDRSPGTDGKV